MIRRLPLLLLLLPSAAVAQPDPAQPADEPEADAAQEGEPSEGSEGPAEESPAEEPVPLPDSPQPVVAPPPTALDIPVPTYPEEALEAGIEGNVVLRYGLNADGGVTGVSVVRDPGGGLGEASAAALREAIFDAPPPGEPPPELRAYFHVFRFVLPEEYRPPPDPDAPPPAEPGDELTRMPALVFQPDVAYPGVAKEAGIQGRALMELDVSAAGDMDAVRLVKEDPVGWGFGLAAVEAAWRFRFEPAFAGEAPVPVRITYTYAFTLEEQIVEREADTPDAGSAIDPEGPVNLSGYVRERGSRSPLTSVEVLIDTLDHSTVTDDFGYFEFRGIPAGEHRVLVAVPGYETFETVEEILPGRASDVVYFVRESAFGGNETVVRVKAERKEVTKRTITVETIERVPGTFGDPVRVVQNLPGVARSPFDFGLLIVRGSGPEDSGPHIDGIRVPQLFHFGGLRSILTPILLDSIDFYPGGFSSRFGRLTGGVLDIATRRDYEDTIHGLVQADLIDASAAITGPIRKKGSKEPLGGFVFAARRSYLDILLPAITPASVDLSRILFPQWTDLQGKLTLRPAAGHELSVLGYFSQDRAGTRIEDPGSPNNEATQGDFSVRTDFWRVNADWTYRTPGGKAANRLLFAVGQDIQAYGVGQFARFEGDVFWWMLRDEAEIRVDEHLELGFGTDIIASLYNVLFEFNAFDLRTLGSDPNSERESFALEDTSFGIAPGVFAEARVDLVDERIRLIPGLRFDFYGVPDQFDIFTLDPRFSFRLVPDPKKILDIKGSVGLYHQNPQPYEVVEITGNTELSAEEALQVSAGFELRFTDFLSLDVQGFYKRLDKLVVLSFAGGRQSGRSGVWQNAGDGHIYGAEVFLRLQKWKGFEGWVALTLQRSMRRDQEDEDYYWFDFDQPVILDVVASYDLPAGFRIGARFRYVSGNPETPILTSIYDADRDSYIPLQGEYNSGRLPDFHALDIRIDKDFNFRRWKLTFYLDILNVYNRQNPESTVYNFDYTEKDYLYGLPILPNIGFKAQF